MSILTKAQEALRVVDGVKRLNLSIKMLLIASIVPNRIWGKR